MGFKTMQTLSVEEKRTYLLNSDQKWLKKICKISPSQLLMLKKMGKLNTHIENKIMNMSEKEVNEWMEKIEK